jgi:hypothetical protein
LARPVISASDERGIALLAALLVMLLISALGASMLVVSAADIGASANFRGAKEAFYEADSGIQRSVIDLVGNNDWAEDTIDGTILPIMIKNPFPDNVTINGSGITLAAGAGGPQPGWYPFGGTENLGNGTFSREIFLPPPDSEQENAKGSKMWVVLPVRSTGAVPGGAGPSSQVVESDVRVLVFRLSIWDNAIFGGKGQSGKSINGNCEVRGSVHVVGDSANPTLIDWGGGATVRNSYVDAATASAWDIDAVKLPSLPIAEINGEMVQSLDAEVRIKHGDLIYGGTSSLGDPNITGNARKETLDGFYADGSVTLTGSAAIYSDNSGEYDIKEDIPFPLLSDPYVDSTGTPWPTHRDFLNTRSLSIPVNEISDNTPAFSLSDALGNSIQWNPGTGILDIQGIIRVSGTLQIGRNGVTSRVEYSGTGTIYATNDLDIRWSVMPVGDYLNTAAPLTHNLGLIADNNVAIATAGSATWVKVMAAIYGEDEISVAKQTRIAGALVSEYFDMGNNVPQVWQVPKIAVNLPPGMPGADPLLYSQRAEVANWMHVRR